MERGPFSGRELTGSFSLTTRKERRFIRLVETESLLNDGTAAVAFAILVAIALGAQATATSVGMMFAWTALGGIVIGAAVAAVLLLIAGRTEDHLVEISLTTIAAYASFLVADHFTAGLGQDASILLLSGSSTNATKLAFLRKP